MLQDFSIPFAQHDSHYSRTRQLVLSAKLQGGLFCKIFGILPSHSQMKVVLKNLTMVHSVVSSILGYSTLRIIPGESIGDLQQRKYTSLSERDGGPERDKT